MKLPKILRTTPPAEPIRAETPPDSKRVQATPEQCRTDYVVGTPERNAFDARARRDGSAG